MVSYLDRFLQDGIQPSTRSTTKVGTGTGYRLLCIYIHIQVEARIVACGMNMILHKEQKFLWMRSSPGHILSTLRLVSSSGIRCERSLNGSGPRDGCHPGGTGTGQNRTVHRLCRMLLPLRLQRRLPCGPHGPALCP